MEVYERNHLKKFYSDHPSHTINRTHIFKATKKKKRLTRLGLSGPTGLTYGPMVMPTPARNLLNSPKDQNKNKLPELRMRRKLFSKL